MKTLVLFDFDGTLTKKDTFIEFIRFYKGSFSLYVGFLLLSPILVCFKLGIYPNWKAKERVMKYFFGGIHVDTFNARCEAFINQKIENLLWKGAKEEVQKHLDNGATVYLVSASPENWISYFANAVGIPFIGTKLEVIGDKITGAIEGKNCYGPEKVIRLKEVLQLEQFDRIIAYGDSSGDKEMFELADQEIYKPFR